MIAVSTSHNGKYIASACKASSPENATIRIFNEEYTQIAVLPGHTLTVTKLAWSDDDSVLVSVGRDRRWTVYDTTTWTMKTTSAKAHGRVIWDVSVGPVGFGFATGSRDKSVKFWTFEGECVASVKFSEAVTACAFLPWVVGEMGYLAVGLENGAVYVLCCEVGGIHWRILMEFDDMTTHSAGVTGLAWRPCGRDGKWELASCGDDCSVRIFEIGII